MPHRSNTCRNDPSHKRPSAYNDSEHPSESPTRESRHSYRSPNERKASKMERANSVRQDHRHQCRGSRSSDRTLLYTDHLTDIHGLVQ